MKIIAIGKGLGIWKVTAHLLGQIQICVLRKILTLLLATPLEYIDD